MAIVLGSKAVQSGEIVGEGPEVSVAKFTTSPILWRVTEVRSSLGQPPAL